MDPKKVSYMVDWPVPKTIKDFRGFLGLTSCYKKFIQRYGMIAQPLTQLLKRGNISGMKKHKKPLKF